MGLDKNTVVIFASDHGETMCSQRTDDPKNSPYSESMNIPFLVRFPGKIQPRVDDLLLSAPDIMPDVYKRQGKKYLFWGSYNSTSKGYEGGIRYVELSADGLSIKGAVSEKDVYKRQVDNYSCR